jgi:hypothetical protein
MTDKTTEPTTPPPGRPGGSFNAPPIPENLAALIGSTDSTASREDVLAEAARRLAETTANLDAYIERRAQEIAAPRITAAEKQARELVAAVWHTAAFDRRRSQDLVAELRRHIAALERRVQLLREETAS